MRWFVALLVLAAPRLTSACLTTTRGPCRSPEPFAYLAAPAGQPPVVVANFGLLLPAPGSSSWQFVCDDQYGVPAPGHVWRRPDGRLFSAGQVDLQFSDDSCVWTAATGDLAGRPVADLAFDRRDPARLWALGVDRPVLYRSLDGGRTFSSQHVFPGDRAGARLLSGDRLYVVAATVGATTMLDLSDDGGDSWTTRELTAGISPPPRNPLTPLAAAPDQPGTLYFLIPDPAGDQIWKTGDAGQSLVRVLQLREGEAFSGFAFGATGDTLFVAGTAPIRLEGRIPARLYMSHDGGQTWADPIASGEQGPFFRCLAFQDGVLLACGAGENGGDRFLVGVSSDRGRTWSPSVRLADLQGARACVRSRCTATELWLCEIYGRCAANEPDGGSPDAAPVPAMDAPSLAMATGGGCSCRLAGSNNPPAFLMVLVLFVVCLTVGRAGWHRRRDQKLARKAARPVSW